MRVSITSHIRSPGPLSAMKPAGGTSTRGAADAGDALGDVAHPGASGDVVVEPGVAVHHDVDAGAMLRRHVAGQTVEMLFAVGEAGEALRERNAAQVFGVPARPRQRAGGGGEKRLVLCGGEHPNFLPVSCRRQRATPPN